MTNVGTTQLAAVLRVARELGELRRSEDLRAGVLPLLMGLVRCDSSSFNALAPGAGAALGVTVEPRVPISAEAVALFGALAHQNPLIAASRERAATRVLTFSDFLTRRELHRLELYDVLYRHTEVEHQIAFALPAPAGQVIGVALNRRRPDFSARDRQMLEAIRPFVAAAYARVVEGEALRATVAALARADDDGGQAAIVLGASGQIELVTGAARRWLHTIGVGGRGDRLPEPIASWAVAQRRAARRPGAARERLRVATPGAMLSARYIAGGREGLDVITLRDDTSVGLDADAIRSLGLTAREAQVLALVAEGCSNAQIARRLTVSEHTIAKHLRHVYAKLGVPSRTAAVARVRRPVVH